MSLILKICAVNNWVVDKLVYLPLLDFISKDTQFDMALSFLKANRKKKKKENYALLHFYYPVRGKTL